MRARHTPPLCVVMDEWGRPRSFLHARRRIRIQEILDTWEEAGRWWQGEEVRRVYRVLTTAGTVCELHHQPIAGWQLHRVSD